ncbi:MAG: methyl-accepting chemotaxis protein [Clostridium sp.]|nr:methyl-accepting chemotaxis protein [Clostridium sp.]
MDKKTGMSIRRKLQFSYLGIVLLILAVGIAGIYSLREVYTNGNEIYENNLKSVEILKSINQNVKQIDQCVIGMMSLLGKENGETYIEEIEKLQSENSDLMKQYDGLEVTDLELRRYNQCRLSILTFDKHIASITDYILQNNEEMAVAAYEQQLMPAKACTYELIDAIVELSTNNAYSKNIGNYRIYKNIIWIITIIIALAVIVAAIVAGFMSNYFTDKLAAIQRLAKRIAEYDVSDDIQSVANDEFGITMEALNESQFMMRELLEKIIDESATLSDTGEEVSMAVRKSGQRIENINVEVLQFGKMIDELDTTVKEILENRSLDEEIVGKLNKILKKSKGARENMQQTRSELSGVAMYLEQIGITSDYQNEIANSHKEQVTKFKV